MTPYHQAREVYNREPCARTFEEDLVAHLENGYVINTPEVFGMFRPVNIDWPEPDILDASRRNCIIGNCWHIWIAAGDLSQFMGFLPYPLPFISFERKNRLRYYRFHQMAEKLSHGRIRRTSLHPGPDRT